MALSAVLVVKQYYVFVYMLFRIFNFEGRHLLSEQGSLFLSHMLIFPWRWVLWVFKVSTHNQQTKVTNAHFTDIT